jgi:hypothetical protein
MTAALSTAFPTGVGRRALRGAVARVRDVGDPCAPCDVEARLVATLRAPARLRRALARVAGRLVATRGWERLGFARLEDYAAERAGVSARELRDLARVDAALAALPALEAAFACGAIGWTQLRLLCRVATPGDEGAWLGRASGMSAAALAREVRAVDRLARETLSAGPADDAREGVVLAISARARARWWSARGVASRVAGHALSHAAFAEVLTAEVLSGVGLEPTVADGAAPRSGRVDPRRGEAHGGCGRPVRVATEARTPEVEALERDLDGADAFEIDRRLRAAVRLEARTLAGAARLLADVVARRLHCDLGYRSVDAYAEDRLGIAPSRARALLRVEWAARACPPLRAAFAAGRVSWVQAYALVPLLLEPASRGRRAGWISHAAQVSVRRLRDDVARAFASGDLSVPRLFSVEGEPAGVQTGADARASEQAARLFFTATPEVAQLFRAVLATVQRRLERIRGRPACTSDALEAMLDHALAAWQPEPASRRARRTFALFERDGWRCTAPGCTSYRNLHQHHVVFRSQGGSDDPSNRTTLCAWHHLRGVHGGVLRCTGAAPDGLRFELGPRPDGGALAVYSSGDVRCADVADVG